LNLGFKTYSQRKNVLNQLILQQKSVQPVKNRVENPVERFSEVFRADCLLADVCDDYFQTACFI
jgi:hypothetical protein